MKLRLLNDTDTLKSTDNATKLKFAITDNQDTILSLEQYTAITVAIGQNGARYSSEAVEIVDDKQAFEFSLTNSLPASIYNIEVTLTTAEGTNHIAPSEGIFKLTIEKSLNEVGDAVTILSVQQLIDDMASTLRVAEEANDKSDDAVAKAESAIDTVNIATADAANAITLANEAKSTANDAVTSADTANDKADTAINTANDAMTVSQQAQVTAGNAEGKADTAISSANTANDTASNASDKAGNALTTATDAKTIAEQVRAEFDSLNEGNTDAEMIAARTDEENVQHTTLKARIDSEANKRANDDATTLQSAKEYVDGKVGNIDLSALSTKDETATALQIAKDYTDTKDVEVLQSAKDYTDGKVGNIDFSTLATKQENEANLQTAKDYTDSKVSNIDLTAYAKKDEVNAMIGDTSTLVTNDKTVVGAINEVANNSGGGSINIAGVSAFELTQDGKGENFTLSWTNPNTEDFTEVEVYVAEIDLSSKTYEQTVADATKIYNGQNTSLTYKTQANTTYFFKIYSKYELLGSAQIDSGASKYLKAIDTVPPGNVTNLTIKEDDAQLTLNWSNPADSDFSKVTIVYKNNGYPANKNDGTIVYEGVGTSVNLTSLTNGTTYYFKVFTEDVNANVAGGVQISGTPADVKVYGVKIDTTNSNPETALTYTDDAVGFTPAKMNGATFSYGSWQNVYPFNAIKPCLFKNGAVVGYLNPNDYSKFMDGTTADITSGNSGDVMIEFPKMWWKLETVGNDLYVRYATKQKDSTYKCLAHQRGTTEKDYCYISAYLGYSDGSKLRSLSGKTPTGSQTIGAFRTLAKANGATYDQMAYYQVLMLQVLYLVMFKNRDSQTAIGRGYVDGNSAATTTGNTNTKGLFYGETTGKVQMKFCGVEDFYGNLLYWLDGIVTDASRNILLANQNFNDTGSGYANYGQGATADIGGYISGVQGGTETGFIAKAVSGSETTYYPDQGYLYASKVGRFGGYRSDASYAGAFSLGLSNAASSSYAIVGARLLAL